jgi:hypothetical protein
MLAQRLPAMAVSRRELTLCTLASAATGLIALAGIRVLGTVGLIAPLAVVLTVILLTRPVLAVTLVVALTIVCEGPSFGILTFTSKLYTIGFKDLTLVDGLVAVAVAAVGLDLISSRRPVRLPRPLVVPLGILVLAMISGVVVGHAAGASLRFAIASEHVLAYLVLLPLAVVNLDLDRPQIARLLGWGLALAGLKAVLGLLELAGHLGTPIEGVTELTYYEPTANWLVMIAALSVLAALLARARPPLWMTLLLPLLTASLLLSYRRSFWIGAVLAVLLVVMLGLTPVGRRLLVPAGLAVLVSIWLLGSIHFQDQIPIVKRAETLAPTKLQASVEDRYRLNERANVVAEIRAHPIEGLGATIPWRATAQTLSIEGEGAGRQYVHFVLLWFWLKLGILGLFAYLGVMIGSMWVAWQAWRLSREPLLRAFALASLCGMVGLLAIDTTASFTGVDPRFTVLFAAQVGLLALIAATAAADAEEPPAQEESDAPALTMLTPAMR